MLTEEEERSTEMEAEEWMRLSELFVYVSLGISLLLIICALYYHKKLKKGSDKPSYISLFRFLQSVSDLWTDVMFCVILYLDEKNNYLFWYCCLTIIVPYTISCIIGIYWIHKWRLVSHINLIRLSQYIKKYDWLFYVGMVFGGFFSIIDLTQSKIFYLKCFYLPLKEIEYIKFKHIKFLIIVLFENIPQFLIQIIYIMNNGFNTIVFFSMTFSVLSMLVAFIAQISRLCQIFEPKSSKFTIKSVIMGQLNIDSKLLKSRHTFANKIISNCLLQVLSFSNISKEWFKRSDLSIEVEVYFIEDFIKTYRKMNCYFDVNVLHFDKLFDDYYNNNNNNNNNKNSKEFDASASPIKTLVVSLNAINVDKSQNYQLMNDALVSLLDLEDKNNPNNPNNPLKFDISDIQVTAIMLQGKNKTYDEDMLGKEVNLTIVVC